MQSNVLPLSQVLLPELQSQNILLFGNKSRIVYDSKQPQLGPLNLKAGQDSGQPLVKVPALVVLRLERVTPENEMTQVTEEGVLTLKSLANIACSFMFSAISITFFF